MGRWGGRERAGAVFRAVERELVSAGVDLRRPMADGWDFQAPGNGLLKVTGSLAGDVISALRVWLRSNKPPRVRWSGLVHPVRRQPGQLRFPLFVTIPLDEAAALLARLETLEREKGRWLDAEPADSARGPDSAR